VVITMLPTAEVVNSRKGCLWSGLSGSSREVAA